MSKICGYSCEHNKSGVCQITGCSKKSYMSDKTETELFRETWYDINQIRQLQQENKQLKDNWNKLKEYIGSEWYCFDNESVEFEVAKSILNKMQELEQGSDSNGQ